MMIKRYSLLLYYFILLIGEGLLATYRRFFPISLEQQSEWIYNRFNYYNRLMGLKVTLLGKENLPVIGDRKIIIICNHKSLVDIAAIYEALPIKLNIRMAAKKELFKIPFFGMVMKVYRFIPIDRQSRLKSVAALKSNESLLNEGVSVFFFPEGTRSPHKKMLPFKKGAFRMALSSDALIIPVAIKGSELVTPDQRLSQLQFNQSVSVHVGPSIDVRLFQEGTVSELVSLAQNSVARLLESGDERG